MSDLGDIFDMFSNDKDENRKPRKQTDLKDKEPENGIKSAVASKLTQKQPLLIATVVGGFAALGGVPFFLVKYGANGAKGTVDAMRPFLT